MNHIGISQEKQCSYKNLKTITKILLIRSCVSLNGMNDLYVKSSKFQVSLHTTINTISFQPLAWHVNTRYYKMWPSYKDNYKYRTSYFKVRQVVKLTISFLKVKTWIKKKCTYGHIAHIKKRLRYRKTLRIPYTRY